jgi:hypothetical protein
MVRASLLHRSSPRATWPVLGLLVLAGCSRGPTIEGHAALPLRETPHISEELQPLRFEATASRGFGASPATIEYTLPHPGHVKISVYDVSGREMGRIVDAWRSDGKHVVEFNFGSGRRQVSLFRVEWDGQAISGKVAAGP